MITKVSTKGQTVIPKAVRQQANLKAGDQLDVGYANGLIILRKRRAMTPAHVRSLILSGRDLPDLPQADEPVVADAVRRARSRRKS